MKLLILIDRNNTILSNLFGTPTFPDSNTIICPFQNLKPGFCNALFPLPAFIYFLVSLAGPHVPPSQDSPQRRRWVFFFLWFQVFEKKW